MALMANTEIRSRYVRDVHCQLWRRPPSMGLNGHLESLLSSLEIQCYTSLNSRLLSNSATVCGGLPVLNVAARDLYGATVKSVRGIFNSTTSYILDRMLAGELQSQVPPRCTLVFTGAGRHVCSLMMGKWRIDNAHMY